MVVQSQNQVPLQNIHQYILFPNGGGIDQHNDPGDHLSIPKGNDTNLMNSLEKIHAAKLAVFDKFCITYEWCRLKNLQNFLFSATKILHVRVNNGPTILTCMKICQILGRDAALYISVRDLENVNLDVETCDVSRNVVIDCDSETRITENTEKLLHRVTGSIYIVSTYDIRSVYPTLSDRTSLQDLEVNSQCYVLEKSVVFQGHEVNLSTLLAHHSIDKEQIDENMISKLLKCESILVGDNLEPSSNNYIPRQLQRGPIVLQKDVLDMDDTFAICGTDKDGLLNFICKDEDEYAIGHYYSSDDKCIPIGCNLLCMGDVDEEEKFAALCEELGGHVNVHLLRLEYDNLVWLNSLKSASVLVEYIDMLRTDASDNAKEYMKSCKTITPQVNTVWEIPESLVLISSEPGMGKSTHLNQVCSRSKFIRPASCIIRANLSHFKTFFKDMKKATINSNAGYKFLLKAFQGRATENFEFCTSLLRCSKQIIVLLDGFDDITSEEVDKAISLMRVIRTLGVIKLWLVSRPVMKRRLKIALSIVCYSLLPFNKKQQKSFLHQCLCSKMPDIDTDTIDNYVSLLLFSSFKRNVCTEGVPLHAIMFAESFEESVRAYHTTGKFEVPDKISVVTLLSAFVHKFRDAYGTLLKRYPNITRAKSFFISVQAKFAMATILSTEDLNRLNDKNILSATQKLLNEAAETLESPFIEEIRDGFVHFKHRIYAEFFVALWFIKHHALNRKFMQERFFTWDYREIRAIFDSILADDHPLHESVVNGDVAMLVDLLNSGADVNETDDCGRTALHVLASVRPCNIKSDDPLSVIENMARILLDEGGNLSVRDKAFHFTPLDYVHHSRAWSMYEVWLERVVDYGMPTYKEMLLVRKADNPLYLAAIHGCVNLISFALDNGLPPNTPVFSANKSTLLHGAAYGGHLHLVTILVRFEADLNVQDSVGMTPLMIASNEGHKEVVETLISEGADLDKQNVAGLTALHFAAKQGHLQIVKLLVKTGCSRNVKNDKGETALDYAKNMLEYSVASDKLYLARVKSVVRYLSHNACNMSCIIQ